MISGQQLIVGCVHFDRQFSRDLSLDAFEADRYSYTRIFRTGSYPGAEELAAGSCYYAYMAIITLLV